MKQSMVTTTDNPYDPFDQFDEWYAFDTRKGYHTLSYLARITITSHELSPLDESQAIDQAVDEIVSMNINGMYKKVTKDVEEL